MHGDTVAAVRSGAVAFLDYLILQPGGCRLHFRTLCVLSEEILAGFGIDFAHFGCLRLLAFFHFSEKLADFLFGFVVSHFGRFA